MRAGTAVQLDAQKVSAAPVRGDATELRRLVRNLLDNVVRHATRQVSVSLEAAGDSVVLDVADDGPGVAPGDRERVFDRFFRGDPARGTDPGGHRGSGLGLAIARGIAERHGGTLELLDPDEAPGPASAGSGAHFRLWLPAAG